MSSQAQSHGNHHFSEQRQCKVCLSSKPLTADFFPKVSGKSEATVRYGPACKICKATAERARRQTHKPHVESPKSVQGDWSERVNSLANPVTEGALHRSSADHDAKGDSASFGHAVYGDGEIQKAVNLFQRLKRWRDTARASGQIAW